MGTKLTLALLSSTTALLISFQEFEKGGKLEELNTEQLELKTIQLGKELFFDESLSNPKGKSCASCHAPNSGFADPDNGAVSEGVFHLKGSRNTPTISYMTYSPEFSFNKEEENYFGGQFWDGRAKNLIEQAKGPLLNHIEMNNSNKKMVVEAVKNSKSAILFKRVFGDEIFANTDQAFAKITEALNAYENSNEISPFTSKFDYYLTGKVKLTAIEKRGLALFNNEKKGNCAACHLSTPDEKSGKVLFTDFTYDNLGIPRNTKLSDTIDYGLGGVLNKASENGKFKVPTLRNVAVTAPYFHNGSFNTLEEVVEFYSVRDSGKFGKPEVNENVNHDELGDLNLSQSEIKAIVAFMKTLTDGYVIEEKK